MTSAITTFILIHVALSLVGIFAGVVVAGGLVAFRGARTEPGVAGFTAPGA